MRNHTFYVVGRDKCLTLMLHICVCMRKHLCFYNLYTDKSEKKYSKALIDDFWCGEVIDDFNFFLFSVCIFQIFFSECLLKVK